MNLYSIEKADLIIDGLFGVGLKGEPRKPFDKLIELVNSKGKMVISIDIPSGMGDSVLCGPGMGKDHDDALGISFQGLQLHLQPKTMKRRLRMQPFCTRRQEGSPRRSLDSTRQMTL